MAEPYMTHEELYALLGDKKPCDVPYIKLTDEITEKYITEAKNRAEEILHIPSIYPTSIKGNCWYLSNNGDDDADGMTENTPWKTTARLHKAQEDGTVKKGDGVFFERGSKWNKSHSYGRMGDYALRLIAGVTYSAYGYGEKPMFSNMIDASLPDDWELTEYENVWAYTGDAGSRIDDIGNIIIDDGKVFAIKIIPHDPNHPYLENVLTSNLGMVTNRLEVFHSGAVPLTSPGCITHNFEFLHDYDARKLYMYCDKGNPGELFDTIYFARRGNIIRCDETSVDVVVDNLMVKYGGSHGINLTVAQNVLIQNCIFGWIGGSFQENDDKSATQYGNGVENWGGCDGFVIRNCIAYEIYDAAFTTQYCGGHPSEQVVMKNVSFSDNIMARTTFPVELWGPATPNDPQYTFTNYLGNIKINNNYVVYSGYNSAHQRPCKNANFTLVGGKSSDQLIVDTEIRFNKFLFTSSLMQYSRYLKLDGMEKGIICDDNIYIGGSDKAYIRGCVDPSNPATAGRLYHYDRETLSVLCALGLDKNSTFYYYDEFLYPEEAQGVYLYM